MGTYDPCNYVEVQAEIKKKKTYFVMNEPKENNSNRDSILRLQFEYMRRQNIFCLGKYISFCRRLIRNLIQYNRKIVPTTIYIVFCLRNEFLICSCNESVCSNMSP